MKLFIKKKKQHEQVNDLEKSFSKILPKTIEPNNKAMQVNSLTLRDDVEK